MAEILLPRAIPANLIDDFIDETLVRPREGRVRFANGTYANNKLNAGYEEVSESLSARVMTPLTRLILQSSAGLDFICPVPTGANGWAAHFARNLTHPSRQEVPVLEFNKIPGEKRRFLASSKGLAQIRTLHRAPRIIRGIVIDDASSDGGTSEALADKLEQQYKLKVDLVVSVFYRGVVGELVSKYNRAILLNRHIPNIIDWDAL